MNAGNTYVGERWRCQLDIINFVHVNDSQYIYLERITFVNISIGNPFDFLTDHQSGRTNRGDRFDNQFVNCHWDRSYRHTVKCY